MARDMTHDETCDVPLNCRFLRDEEKRDCLVARPLKRREDRGTDGHVISPVVFYILTYSCLLIYAVLVTALLSNSSCSEHQLRREAHKKEGGQGKKGNRDKERVKRVSCEATRFTQWVQKLVEATYTERTFWHDFIRSLIEAWEMYELKR